MNHILKLPWRFLRVCWFHGIGAAISLTHEIVVNRRMALQVKYPYESQSNSAAWLPLLRQRPLISIVMPVFNSPWLEEAVASVLRQNYGNFELILVDDCSTAPRTIAALQHAAGQPRVRLERTAHNLGVSGATNAGIAAARGDYVGFMDHDDILHHDALALFVRTVNQETPASRADVYFTDEVRLDRHGNIAAFTHKSQPSLDNLLSCNAVAHFCIIRRAALTALGPLNSAYDGAQDHELMLRAMERGLRFRHLPYTLYGWRQNDQSMSSDTRRRPPAAAADGALPAAYRNGKRMLRDYLARQGIAATVTDDGFPWYRVKYALPAVLPPIAIIIPFHDRTDCLRTLLASVAKSTYPDYRVYLVDNRSREPETRRFLAGLDRARCELLEFDEPFNYSRLHNVIVERLAQEVLVFLNNDMEVITPDWLEAMLEHVLRAGVAAVGCKLLRRNGRVQHAGLTFRPSAWLCAQNITDAEGYDYHKMQREVAGVTAACMMIRRSVFRQVGGFNEIDFPIGFSDADLCLRLRQAGWKIMYTPFARLYHDESATRRKQEEAYEKHTLFTRYAGQSLMIDPHFNTLVEE